MSVTEVPPGCLTGSHFLEGDIPDPLGKGARAVKFIEMLQLTEGAFAGRRFKLDTWQERLVRKVYGDLGPTGLRKVRTVFVLIPRGNGKTCFASALALLGLFGPEREAAGQVISAAADRQQASICYNSAARMVRADPELARRARIVDSQRIIKHADSNSDFRAVSHEAYSKHGLSISTLFCDEIHAWPSRELYEVLISSQGKRVQPLNIVTTTAGAGRGNLAWDLYEYALRVETGEVVDESFLPVIFQAPADCNWQDEAVWHAVNPALGAGYRSLDEMRTTSRRAAAMPSQRQMFQQMYLNIWQESSTSTWMDMQVYDAGCTEPVTLADFAGAAVTGGVDLASVSDLAALYIARRTDDGGWMVWGRQYCPEDQYRKRVADNLPYDRFLESGRLVLTPGNAIDLRRILGDVAAICNDLDVRSIAVDRWGATGFMQQLQDLDLPGVEFGQGTRSMSAPCKEIERAILGKVFHAGGDPILRWNFANVRVEPDAGGNIMFSKSKSKDVGKIDGAVAVAMAIGGGLVVDEGYITAASTPIWWLPDPFGHGPSPQQEERYGNYVCIHCHRLTYRIEGDRRDGDIACHRPFCIANRSQRP